jgi:hypothetical protein
MATTPHFEDECPDDGRKERVPPECPRCLTHHSWSHPCTEDGMVERLRARIREQGAELRARRAAMRPECGNYCCVTLARSGACSCPGREQNIGW